MVDDLDKLTRKGVPQTHIQCLRWFRENEDNIIVDSEKLTGIKGSGNNPATGKPYQAHKPIAPNQTVSELHYIHPLVRGSYKPGGAKIVGWDKDKRGVIWEGTDDFVQAIQSSKNETQQGYSNEVKFDAKGRWTEINYNHKLGGHYFEITGGHLLNCYKEKIPIGIIYREKKSHNKILGLGLITEVSQNQLDYKIEPYNRKKLERKSEQAIKIVTKQIEKKDYSSKGKETTVRSRLKSGWFKDRLLEQYDSKCALCEFSSKPYLVGAHIVPKNVMDKIDPKNAMKPSDGILLCKLCDIAFEHGHIIVDEKYKITVSDALKHKSKEKPNEVMSRWVKSIKKKISLKKNSKWNPSSKYLAKKATLVKNQKIIV